MDNVTSYIWQEIQASLETHRRSLHDTQLLLSAEVAAKKCVNCLKSGRKVIFAGNGGSAADSQHLAAELVSRLNFDRPGLAAIALTTDTSALTAIGNDYGFERLFARQLEALGNQGDVIFALSTSGASQNILALLETARSLGVYSVGMTGNRGGPIIGACDQVLAVPDDSTARIQEIHILLGHAICGEIERQLFEEPV